MLLAPIGLTTIGDVIYVIGLLSSKERDITNLPLTHTPISLPMSLPAAKKQTTEKPAAGAVIDPVNKATKEADIDRQVRVASALI